MLRVRRGSGREITNPVMRWFLFSVMMMWTLVFMLLLLLVSPLLVIVHYVLKAFGRRGFVKVDQDGRFDIEISSVAWKEHG